MNRRTFIVTSTLNSAGLGFAVPALFNRQPIPENHTTSDESTLNSFSPTFGSPYAPWEVILKAGNIEDDKQRHCILAELAKKPGLHEEGRYRWNLISNGTEVARGAFEVNSEMTRMSFFFPSQIL